MASTSLADGAAGPFEGSAADRVVLGGYLRDGVWSPELVGLLAGLCGRGGTLLDVGANIGLVAIPVVERTAASAICFEAEPGNARLLRRNAARHRLGSRLRVEPVALYDRAGRLSLALSADNGGDHRVAAAAAAFGGRARTHVCARRLDDLLAGRELATPVVMKLDVQGAEVRVLRGARRTLARVDALVVEYWPRGLLEQGDSVPGLQSELAAFAYGCVLPQDGALPALVPLPALWRSLAFVPADDAGFFDLLLVKAHGLWRLRRPELRAPAWQASGSARG